MRKLISLEANYARVPEEQITAIAEELFLSTKEDPSLFLDALKSLGDFELLGVLSDELREHPMSPISIELRRRVKQKCKTEARIIARHILRL